MIELLIDGATTYCYSDLFEAINSESTVNTLVQEEDFFRLFVRYVSGIVHGVDLTVVDSDLSDIEKNSLDTESKAIQGDGEAPVESFQDLVSIIEKRRETWRLRLFTSGTTGRPKSVTHSLESLTRMVRTGARYEKNVWGFAYNPTHFAGFQVFFQALLNCNVMVKLFGRPYPDVLEAIDHHAVTHISATPTFVRGLLGQAVAAGRSFPSVRRLTTGGERFDERLVSLIAKHFPNARVNNIYASTEAGSLFVGHGNVLSVPDHLRNVVRFSSDNEILIHKSLLGTGEDLDLDDGGWFNTGDIVDNPDLDGFRIEGRRSDFINVGGYKVNPHEVETVVRIVPGVVDVLCYGINNPITGKIVAVDVVSNGDRATDELERAIHQRSDESLQRFKRPRIVNIVKSLDQTHTGKLARK